MADSAPWTKTDWLTDWLTVLHSLRIIYQFSFLNGWLIEYQPTDLLITYQSIWLNAYTDKWRYLTSLLILTWCCGIPSVQSWLTVKEAANKICPKSYLFSPCWKPFLTMLETFSPHARKFSPYARNICLVFFPCQKHLLGFFSPCCVWFFLEYHRDCPVSIVTDWNLIYRWHHQLVLS